MVDLALLPPGEEASGGGDRQDTKGENHITPYTYFNPLVPTAPPVVRMT